MNGVSIEQLLAIFNGDGTIPAAKGDTPDGSFLDQLMGFSHRHSASGLGAAAENSESISCLTVPQAGEKLFALKLDGISPEILENQKRIADPENVPCESPDLIGALFRNSRLHRIDLAGFLPCEQNGCQRQDEINESSLSSDAPSINSIREFLGSMHAPQGAACNGFQWNIITENPPAGDDPDIDVVTRTLMQRNERSAGGDHALYPDLDWKELLTRHLSLTKTAKIGALDAQKDPEGNGVKGNNGSESRPPMTFPVTQRNARILSSPPLTIVGGESDVAEEMTVLAVRENEGDGESRSQNSKSAGNIRDFLIGGKKNDAGLNNLRDSRLIISQSRPRPEPIPTTKQVSEDGWNHKQLNEGLYKLISSASLSKSEGIQRLTIDKKMADISPNTALSKKQHFSELAVEPLSVLDSPMKTAPATRRAQNIAIENAVLDDVKKSIRSFQKKGDNRMEIRLHPPYLGRLRIEINVNAKYVNTIIIADNHLVKEILEINANQLRDSLQEHGLQMEGFQVHVNAQGSRNGQEYDKPGYYRHGFDNVDDNHNPESQPQETQLWSEYGFSIFI